MALRPGRLSHEKVPHGLPKSDDRTAGARCWLASCPGGKCGQYRQGAVSRRRPHAAGPVRCRCRRTATTEQSDAVQFQFRGAGQRQGYQDRPDTLDDAVPFSKLVSDSVRSRRPAAGAQLVYCDSKGDGATALACAKTFKVQGVQGYLNFQSDAKSADAICAAGPKVPGHRDRHSSRVPARPRSWAPTTSYAG